MGVTNSQTQKYDLWNSYKTVPTRIIKLQILKCNIIQGILISGKKNKNLFFEIDFKLKVRHEQKIILFSLEL